MDSVHNGNGVKKQEDVSDNLNDVKDKREGKQVVVKTLNRVPRACNACRKQKMRCEGADNPPCRRCRNSGLECLFEKPSREATLTGEAGLERIRSLESHVAEIRVTQTAIQSTLQEIAYHIRGGPPRSPTNFSTNFQQQSPSMQSIGSPSMSTSPDGTHLTESPSTIQAVPGGSGPSSFTSQGSLTPLISPPVPRQPHNSAYTNSVVPQVPGPPQPANSYSNFGPPTENHHQHSNSNQLPPISSIGVYTPHSSGAPSARYPDHDQSRVPYARNQDVVPSSSKRPPPVESSSDTNPSSSDDEALEEEGLPARGLVAPWEVLRGLAEAAAAQRANKENWDSSEPHSRTRSPTPNKLLRPHKRRRLLHKNSRKVTFTDVVTKNIINDAEARELFRIFYQGCSTFLPVFDARTDTYDALHARSPFAVNSICMVAARVRDGGGDPGAVYAKCLEEVQAISCATLFAPVTRCEAVQAMILVSGWSDNGWLSGGHAVRMAMELSMHRAWPRLLQRMNKQGPGDVMTDEDRQLAITARTWFCLYLFEHQMSYGTGRPAVMKDDESIWLCRRFLNHPLTIEDDMRLVSTVELMAIRERINNTLGSLERPVDDHTFEVLRQADEEFTKWYKEWDAYFAQHYESAAFYRQSLQIQHYHAELFHNATALRGINGPEDVRNMPEAQRQLALRSIDIARKGLDITINSSSYREGMKYAVHYTHATATFAASFLLRLAQLFPNDCDQDEIRTHVEKLVTLLSEVPGKRYALTLQLMLKRTRKRMSRSPQTPHQAPPLPSMPVVGDPHLQQQNNAGYGRYPQHPENIPPNFERPYPNPQFAPPAGHLVVPMVQPPGDANVERIYGRFEMTANDQIPFWLSDQSLGGYSFQQFGMDAFLLPHDYLPPTPQIW